MSDILIRYKEALERLSDDKPMMKAKESGITTLECKTRILYAKRVLKTTNRNAAIELGVIAEMESQSKNVPIVSEVLVGEHPLSKSR